MPEAPVLGSNDRPARALMEEAQRLYVGKRYRQAADLASRAVDIDPTDIDLVNARGVVLRAGGRAAEAVWCFRRVLAQQPRNAGAWSNLGNALKDLKQTETAISCQRRAIELEPANPACHRNLGLAMMAANRHQEAIAAFDHALRFDTDERAVRFDRAQAYLHLGNYERGWPGYAGRERDLDSRHDFPGQRWMGKPYRGQRLLVVAEQGHGDALWAGRYFRQAKALGGELIVECHDALIPLFEKMPEVDRVVELGTRLPDADFHDHLCSLPGHFTRDLASIPGQPYMSAPPERGAKFTAMMKRAGRALRVGIVWSGSLSFGRNSDRAAPLRAFMQAFAMPGVQLYSLQKGPPERELHALSKGAPIIDLAPLINDFADSAAAIDQLDLVIMTDTAVAHLCGALGKPVWLLLGHVSYWLWLLDRSDSPWYPSMRLFRQPSWGDWGSVFDAAGSELLELSLSRLSG